MKKCKKVEITAGEKTAEILKGTREKLKQIE